MIYYSLVFIGSFLMGLGLLLMKKPFFRLSRSTLSLLDTILDNLLNEDEKQKLLIQKVGVVLSSLFLFTGILLLSIAVSLAPILAYNGLRGIEYENMDTSSFQFFGFMLAGFTIPFVLPSKKSRNNYSDWSILLHQIILDNFNISKSIFRFEKKKYLKTGDSPRRPYVIVTGLARAGTTALTKLLYETNSFYSLSYTNMPFLLGVNLWGRIYKPKDNDLRERAHGDQVLFGYNTIEALEEYFFKVQLRDSFIRTDGLVEHQITPELYQEYLDYQSLIGLNAGQAHYLAKNNNLILRYGSMRSIDPDFKVIMLFREPTDHAASLLSQHLRFSSMQKDDPFVLEYMNWLGHHEFGLNHRPFNFEGMMPYGDRPKEGLDYWIISWINYYTRILESAQGENLVLVDYNDFLTKPDHLLRTLESILDIPLNTSHGKLFDHKKKPAGDVDKELLERANSIYTELVKLKITV